MKTISFIIPVYRNEGSLIPTYEQITALFITTLKGYDYEVVFIDDGSDDNSFQELMTLRKKDNKVNLIKLSRNFGQRSAVLCGLHHASGDAVVKMSADLQEPINSIPKMIQEWENDNEIVIYYRHQREDAIINRLFSNIFYNFIRLTNPNVPKGGFDFFLIGRNALNHFNQIHYHNRFIQGDVLSLGFSVKYLPYKRLKRTIGKSQNTFSKRVKFFIDGILNASYLPIRFISFLGIIISLIGISLALFIIYNKLTNDAPYIGWASLMVLNLIIGGLIMFMLGIIGEYIWRIYDETKHRPNYVIDKIYSSTIETSKKAKVYDSF